MKQITLLMIATGFLTWFLFTDIHPDTEKLERVSYVDGSYTEMLFDKEDKPIEISLFNKDGVKTYHQYFDWLGRIHTDKFDDNGEEISLETVK